MMVEKVEAEKWVTMQRAWWWSWAHSSEASSECSVWLQELRSFLRPMKRRGTIRDDLGAEAERGGLAAPAIFEDVPGLGICATAGGDGLAVMHRSLGLCISCTLLNRSSSSTVTADSTGESKQTTTLIWACSSGPFWLGPTKYFSISKTKLSHPTLLKI